MNTPDTKSGGTVPAVVSNAGSAAQRVSAEWSRILKEALHYRESIYETTPELRDALTELARLSPNTKITHAEEKP